jgi:putative Holliday junction resolvase
MCARGRLLGLDIGDKRIGMAVSDEIGITAQPLGTLTRSRLETDIATLIRTARENEVAAIVAGMPVKLDGSPSPQTRKVESFVAELRKHSDVPVHTWDERFTTTSAEASLIEANMRRKSRRAVIDTVAAQIMLQHYLDCNPPAERGAVDDRQDTGLDE